MKLNYTRYATIKRTVSRLSVDFWVFEDLILKIQKITLILFTIESNNKQKF